MFIRIRSFVRSAAEKSGMIKTAREEPRASESLRRYKPDQVQRVVARSDISALTGLPFGHREHYLTSAGAERAGAGVPLRAGDAGVWVSRQAGSGRIIVAARSRILPA